MIKPSGTKMTLAVWIAMMWMCPLVGVTELEIPETLTEQSGALAHSVPHARSVAPIIQASEAEVPLAQAPAVAQPSVAALAKRATTSATVDVPRLTIVKRLIALRSKGRTDAVIEAQLGDSALPQQKADARSAERLWSDGDITGAITVLERLEAAGALAGVAVNWLAPQEAVSESDRGVDVRIGENPGEYLTGATRTALDFHAETGNAYAIVAWGDEAAIVDRVAAHQERGADHVALQVLPHDGVSVPMDHWRRLAEALDLG